MIGKQDFQLSSNLAMQLCPASRGWPHIADFAIKPVNKFVARKYGSIRSLLRACRLNDVLPARQPLTDFFESIQSEICGRGTCSCREHHTFNAPRLQRTLLFFA